MNTEELKKLKQEEKSLSAEEKLKKALERLQAGKPVRTKAKGRLTLNKINNEAGLGRSYIHKFKDFVENVANPAIEKYNDFLGGTEQSEQSASGSEDMSEIDKLRVELNREKELKVEYRRERDEAIAINTKLETINKSLMFRVYELQEQLSAEVVEFEHHKK
ncbi:hypothetical protein C1S99_18425 [Vibrio parahaemolyticus]|uniref:hypothetical protein n=1 Tax=Vibrio parahaemolyticus TaxID=670 RepID=UPI000C86BA8F|nr:hypothetical protein [Vibrio parahaemolyticus]EJB8690715.1 hypothetical protein [Vibrio parahaemolyticus]PMS40233.1 hypothetical protein C1T12_20310 [Vibrio parahaemolyticus]PMS61004.1 hypothetical protein C1S91_21155 [Vibrio parahaemolyticus]PMS66488.1 hypothetical protein C1S96_19615 [Vibrio parahaemolyticus]PMS71384.1 hypothetical protein C1T10_21150 [Vibrio parahaemolyticus]